MKNLYLHIPVAQAAQGDLALATITGSSGSTPQKAGISALFGRKGLLTGTIGGGVLEAEVQRKAQAAILSKQSGLFHFSFQHSIEDEHGAICGGRASVLIDAAPAEHQTVFAEIKQSLLQRINGVMVTRITGMQENRIRIHRSWHTRGDYKWDDEYSALLREEITSMLRAKPGDYREFTDVSLPDELYFLEPVFPLPRLIIAGAGHIGRALAHQGRLLDFSVTVVDERAEYANPDLIPDADTFVVEAFETAMQSVSISGDTYIVIVTPGHKHDAEALRACIGSGAAYIGMIGSSNKVALMRGKFISEGWTTPEQWNAVYAPVGISIGSQTVEEIAVSIAAELVMVRNSKS